MDAALFDLMRGYGSLFPPGLLTMPSHLSSPRIHDLFLNSLLLNPHFQAYPPSQQYQRLFWKWAISHLESLLQGESDMEIDARILDHYISLLSKSRPLNADTPDAVSCSGYLTLQQPPSPSFVTHFWRIPRPGLVDLNPGTIDLADYQTTTLLESRSTIESGTTGLRTWLACLFLSQYLILHPELVWGRRILELGSGTGLLGIIVASLQQQHGTGPPSLWMTDVNGDVLERCRNNVNLPCNLSSSHPNTRYRLLDWSAALDDTQSGSLSSLLNDGIDAELILGADLVFDPRLIPALVAVLRLALQPSPQVSRRIALVALTVRNHDTLALFLDSVLKQGLVIEDLNVSFTEKMFFESAGNDANDGVRIFKITI